MKANIVKVVLCLVILALAGCGGANGPETRNSITVKGSDTMVILGQRWAEVYMNEYPDIQVQVTGGGSGTGIAALINGGTDICQASRSMKEKEKEMVRNRHQQDVKETPVALDGIAIYVHEDSPIQSLSIAQLKGIYTGQITNWRDSGGEDAKIIAYSRENNSGTYVFFKEHVMDKEDFARDIQTLPGTAAVVNAVSKDIHSIGYGGIAYSSGVNAVAVKGDSGEACLPSLETVRTGEYPLARQLFFYTIGEPEGRIKAFIDWTLGAEGQKICETVGYYPLRKS